MTVRTVDYHTYRRDRLRGTVEPGIYSLVASNGAPPPTCVSVPSRHAHYARSDRGRLWHRVRCLEIRWRDIHGRWAPRLITFVWCGPFFHSPVHLTDDLPATDLCARCFDPGARP